MTVYEFLYLGNDNALIEIYNLYDDTSDILMIDDAQDKYGNYEVVSFDSYINNNRLCINIYKETIE